MLCYNNNQGFDNNPTTILALCKKIDQMQKEALVHSLGGNCETCLLKTLYNTKPIAVYTDCGLFRTLIDCKHDDTTYLYRIEEVRGNETVLLRLLKTEFDQIVPTDKTVVLKISCICAIECFESINCPPCRF